MKLPLLLVCAGTAALSLSAALPLGLQIGKTKVQEVPDDTLGFGPFRKARVAKLEQEIQGAWSISSFVHAQNETPALSVKGNAIFHDGYMAIVIHTLDRSLENFEREMNFQSSFLHYRFEESTFRLQTSTLVGHNNLDGELVSEETWTPREFEVTITGNLMEMHRPDGSILNLVRMERPAFPEKALETMRIRRGGGNVAPSNVDDF